VQYCVHMHFGNTCCYCCYKYANDNINTHASRTLQSGTTACIATVEAAPSHLLTIANVGDSRALLLQRAQHSSIWQAVQLTTDHKPDCESERQRVMSKGGRVTCYIMYTYILSLKLLLSEKCVFAV
jgi:Protein phosphatase 2C